MAYLVLARKWRPQQFDDVVAQEHITQTLKNAIINNRLAHSYLFCGPRGVGKTTTARILAKALNCVDGPTATPCNKCPSCIEITKGKNIDVIEIDGASNRGIEDIRELREKVKYTPTGGRYKVYIIDEVHMLTTEAFNALLKTLEEPPEHVIFIFATTDPQKMPATVLSRCQRFDFRRIPSRRIVDWLSHITQEEGISIEEEALFLIAKKADGGMRDSESILDQIISFKQDDISTEDVVNVLGIVHQDFLFEFSESIYEKDSGKVLNLLDNLISNGYDIVEFTNSLVEHFRNLLISKIQGSKSELLDIPPAYIKRYQEEAAKFGVEDLMRLQQIAINLYGELRKTTQPRVMAELALVKMCKLASAVEISELISHLSNIEKNLDDGDTERPTIRSKKNAMRSKVSSKKKDKSVSKSESLQPVTQSPPQIKPKNIKPIDNIDEIWAKALGEVKKNGKNVIYSMLTRSKILSFNGNSLRIGLGVQFFIQQLQRRDNTELLQNIVSNLSGRPISLEFFLDESIEEENGRNGRVVDAVVSKKTEDYFDDPLIKKAVEIFDGEVLKSI